MDIGEQFCKNIDYQENLKQKKISFNKQVNNKKSADANYLVKTFLTWFIGGIISLMPTFTNIYVSLKADDKDMIYILKEFFSNKDLFLVITTLSISAFFEVTFNGKAGIGKNIIISIESLLAIISMHLFSLLQYEVLFSNIYYFSAGILSICIVASVFGYYIISRD